MFDPQVLIKNLQKQKTTIADQLVFKLVKTVVQVNNENLTPEMIYKHLEKLILKAQEVKEKILAETAE